MPEEIGVVERYRIETLARRKALRRAIEAVKTVPQANKGAMDLIRRDKAIAAISHLETNGLVWGGIFIEEGPEQK